MFLTSATQLLLAISPSLRGLLVPFVVLLVAILVAVSFVILFGAARRARGTTLLAPLVWSLLSLTLVVAAYLYLLQPTRYLPAIHQHDDLWLIALCASFCPLLALLGAKRPQNRMWQWIVVSFWIVAALPALQSLVLHPHEPLEVSSLWSWFYSILLLLGAANFFPTRYALPALLITAGQIILFLPYLPVGLTFPDQPLVGLTLISAGICLVQSLSKRPVKEKSHQQMAILSRWNRIWIDFSNAYGLVWGVRVMDRIESILQSTDAQAWLQWSGFRSASRQDDQAEDAFGEENLKSHPFTASNPEQAVPEQKIQNPLAPAESSIRSLLLRFVSNEWIDSRLNAK
jgi:hypothetical protein